MKWRVLLVDDDHEVMRVVRTAFNDDDFEVTGVQNGRDALAAIENEVPDLIVLDVRGYRCADPDADGTRQRTADHRGTR